MEESAIRAGRINRIAHTIGAKRYLEVGVCQGTTFFQVEVDEKVAVDPVFQFDHRAHAASKTIFHQMPSDDYFASMAAGRFDLIYLDGLHTYEQTLRDLLNSLRVAHDDTVWLIDDTVPTNSYAALPDEALCFDLRRQAGIVDYAWMGDVFKVVFFVGAMMPDFEILTFTGHGQTVLWRPSSRGIPRRSLPLADISSLSFDDMLEHMEMMRVSSDEEIAAAISAFADGIGRKRSDAALAPMERVRRASLGAFSRLAKR